MAKYLDPKADVTFKKVFGEHKNLVISLLNSLLPLDKGKQVESIEYLPPELVPRTPIDKDTSVDVRARDAALAERDAEKARADAATVERDAATARTDAATEKLRQTARNLKAMNLSVEQIATATGLAPDEIKDL